MRYKAQVATRIASSALILVFVALIVSTIAGAMAIRRAAEQTKAAVTLSARYEYIERQLWKEASLVRVHGVNWQNTNWYANVAEEHAVTVAIETTLGDVAITGPKSDTALANRVLADHARYVEILRVLFAQIDEGRPAAADTFDRSTRLFDIMQSRVDERASQQHALATAALAELDATQSRIVNSILCAALVCLALLVISAAVIFRYRHLIESARKAELSRFAELALTDPLTGLGNHRAYQDDLERELARRQRHGGSVSLALIDVDNFKNVNDSRGHIQGDSVLAALGTMLLGLRKSDRAFRLGGDEFAVILPYTAPAEAVHTMERLRLAAATALDGATISIGTAGAGPGVDAVTLRARADAALYAAKRRGRNSVVAYDEARDGAVVRSTEKESAIRQLIDDGRMEVVFQPIWDVRERTPMGFEALVRPAEIYGLDGPQEAFDLAEKLGLAAQLDSVALRAILVRAAELPPQSLLFINVVPETLGSAAFAPAALVEAVAAAGVAPERIVIELTERSMRAFDVIVCEAKRLQVLGFRIALDDTGAGNAGLDVLRNLCVDFVKIDRAVVLQAMGDPVARAIVTGIVDIARAMDSYVIAEGIETIEALRFVCRDMLLRAPNELAVSGAQGYLLGRPERTPWTNPQCDTAAALLGSTHLAPAEPDFAPAS